MASVSEVKAPKPKLDAKQKAERAARNLELQRKEHAEDWDRRLAEAKRVAPETIPDGIVMPEMRVKRDYFAEHPGPYCDRCQDPQPRIGAFRCQDCKRDLLAEVFCEECDRNIHMKSAKLLHHVRVPVAKADVKMFDRIMYLYYRNPMWALPYLLKLAEECPDLLLRKHSAWRLMIMYHLGWGVDRDEDRAIYFCEKALHLKHVVAPGYLAYLKKDYAKAKQLLEESLAKYKDKDPLDDTPYHDGGDAYFLLAVMADKGLVPGTEPDEKQAMVLYEQATFRRNFMSYFNMALIWWNGWNGGDWKTRRNQVKTFACIHKICDAGYGPAFFVMGKLYETAIGQDEEQEPDGIRAIEKYEVAGDLFEDPMALFQLAEAHHWNMLSYFISGPQSIPYLVKCYKAKFYPAFDMLAELYRNGPYPRLLPHNVEFAYQLVCAGADHNDRECIFRKGQYMTYGWGCQADAKQGRELVMKALEMGCPEAMFERAVWMENGTYGEEKDMPRAIEEFQRLAAMAFKPAVRLCRKRKYEFRIMDGATDRYDRYLRFMLPRELTVW